MKTSPEGRAQLLELARAVIVDIVYDLSGVGDHRGAARGREHHRLTYPTEAEWRAAVEADGKLLRSGVADLVRDVEDLAANQQGHEAVTEAALRKAADADLDDVRRSAIAALRNGTTLAEVATALIDADADQLRADIRQIDSATLLSVTESAIRTNDQLVRELDDATVFRASVARILGLEEPYTNSQLLEALVAR